jgi:phosphatidylserine decarboxylase
MPFTKNRRRFLPIAAEGWPFIFASLILTLVVMAIGWSIPTILLCILTVFVVAFFRDPERRCPRGPGSLLSPADGKVTAIDEVEIETPDGARTRMRRVSIFLSIFNVHIQRTPTYGRVESVKYNPGKFINAMSDKSSEENENNLVWVRSAIGWVGVRQIAGLIARRIVCKVAPGDNLTAGQRIGLIRFGSRTDAYFPLDTRIETQLGRMVRAGIDVLAVSESAKAVEAGAVGESA